MALPSQGGFSSLRGGGMYRRRRRRTGVTWLFVGVVIVGLTWMFWPDSEALELPEPMIEISSVTEPIATPPVVSTVSHSEVEEVFEQPVRLAEAEPEPAIEKPTRTITPIPLTATTSLNLEAGMLLLDNGQMVEARQQLSNALKSGALSENEAAQARGVLTDISDTLVFAPAIEHDDPYSVEYIIRSGDTLSGIVQKMGLQVDWRFIQRINGIKQASGIRPGQNLKLVTGPFHAVVSKDSYRIDLFLGDGEDQVFVRSYRVGLGEYDSTPLGFFKVRRHSKLVNPTWINPRTREFYSADNPENPIGERWIGLEGIEERTKDLSGLGIHGTIEPQTIGTQASMGCVRMHSADVTQVYEMLSEGVSTVEIK
jgi:LysM repeat protein